MIKSILGLIMVISLQLDGHAQQQWLDAANRCIDNQNDSAIYFVNKTKDYARKTNNQLLLVRAIETEGLYYELLKSDYQTAANLYMQGIRICEKNNLDYVASLNHSLGVLFHVSDNFEKALEYYQKALSLARAQNEQHLAGKTLVNLASVNSSLSRYEHAQNLFEESLTYDLPFETRQSAYSNLANLYIRTRRYEKAIPLLKNAIATDPATGLGGDIVDYSYLINARTALRDFDGIDSIVRKAESLMSKTESLRKRTILLKSMGNLYEEMGDFKTASLLKDRYILAYDSLKNLQRDETVYDMETKYQTEKKQGEIDQTEKEKRQLTWLVASAAIAILILGFLVYSNLKQKKKLATKKSQLEKLVDEKNLLLRETHHRVKNSFQIVSSLLYLQSETIQDKEAALAVKEAQNRVKSMVLIHQKLYSKDQLVGINAKEYLDDLVHDIIDNQSAENIKVEKSIEPLVLGIDTVTPIGLIANELITNILKHAFDSTIQNPTIQIGLTKNDDTLNFRVSDNGKGMGTRPKMWRELGLLTLMRD